MSIMCVGGCSKMNGIGTITGSWNCKGCRREESTGESKQSCIIFALTGSMGFASYHVVEMIGSTLGIPQVVPFTTRPRHMNEVNGQQAHFVSAADFSEAEDNAEFLSVSEYDGHRYGIKSADLERMVRGERSICLRTDLEGAQKLKVRYGDNVVRISIDEEENEPGDRKKRLKTGSTYEHAFLNIDFPYLMFDLTKTLESYMELDLVEDF